MKRNGRAPFFVFVMQLVFMAHPSHADDIHVLTDVYLPCGGIVARKAYSALLDRALDGFGAYRKAGHKHAGLDIRTDYEEPIYAIGNGVVRAVYGAFPYKTVLVEHLLPTGRIVFSAYTHIEDIGVVVDQRVDESTQIGRAFDEREFARADFYKNHVHVEIRKTMERYKGISIKCFTMEELNVCFFDPAVFFKEHLR